MVLLGLGVLDLGLGKLQALEVSGAKVSGMGHRAESLAYCVVISASPLQPGQNTFWQDPESDLEESDEDEHPSSEEDSECS